jgi:hypothetical protein
MYEDRLDYPAALRVHPLAQRECEILQLREEALQRFLDDPYRSDSLRDMDRSDVDAILASGAPETKR